jgi:hypothetical protein
VEGFAFQQETKFMSREIPKPFLIAKHDDGAFRLTLRNTRFNSWGYPLTDSTPVDETFKSPLPPAPMPRSIMAPSPASSPPSKRTR